jgi:hypothetical protein
MPRSRFFFVVCSLLAAVPTARADVFDNYTNNLLAKVPDAGVAKEVKRLTPDVIVESGGVIPNNTSALLMVHTSDGRFSKVLVQSARKRLNDENKTLVPILLIERYVTYRPGTDRTIEAQGQNVLLFDGFHFSLDMGQVVPEKIGGDLRFTAKEEGEKMDIALESVGKAKIYLLTKALPDTAPKKTTKFVLDGPIEPQHFNGKFKLHDDGRRSGTLTMKVDGDGAISGSFVSDKDGQEYEVVGKIAMPKHSIELTMRLPRAEQKFKGFMFTGNGLVITGTSKLQDREAGFYMTRIEEE